MNHSFVRKTGRLADEYVSQYSFLRKLAEEKGVQYAKEASSHKSDRYIWCYMKPIKPEYGDDNEQADFGGPYFRPYSYSGHRDLL
jgi:hypothetical protein